MVGHDSREDQGEAGEDVHRIAHRNLGTHQQHHRAVSRRSLVRCRTHAVASMTAHGPWEGLSEELHFDQMKKVATGSKDRPEESGLGLDHC